MLTIKPEHMFGIFIDMAPFLLINIMNVDTAKLMNFNNKIFICQHIDSIQSVQDNYFKKVFQVADSGTPV